ncbi:hypothetical protein FOZ61_010587, partial [Perkinsus olseni]
YERAIYDADALTRAMEITVLKIRHECEVAFKDNPSRLPCSLANFLVSDGRTIIATRYAWGREGEVVASCSLYYISGSRWTYFPGHDDDNNNQQQQQRGGGGKKGINDNYHMVMWLAVDTTPSATTSGI